MLIIKIIGTTIKNFDLIFWDFIKHPIASRIKDKINKVTNKIIIPLKLTKKKLDMIFWRLFI